MEEVASTVRTGDFGEKTGRERAAKARESSPGSISSVGARESTEEARNGGSTAREASGRAWGRLGAEHSAHQL